MADYDKQFTPEEINEQIRHFSLLPKAGPIPTSDSYMICAASVATMKRRGKMHDLCNDPGNALH